MVRDGAGEDGGLVVALVLLVAAIAYALFSSVAVYAAATASAAEGKEKKTARLLSGVANVGNAVVLAIMMYYLYLSRNSDDPYIIAEIASVDNVLTLVVVMVINGTVGMLTLLGVTAARRPPSRGTRSSSLRTGSFWTCGHASLGSASLRGLSSSS